jgi:MFS superfamily sulfate permease-like transporter
MVIIYININIVSKDPCSDKTKLTEKLDYVYTLVRGLFIISTVITVALTIGIIFLFVRSYINKRKEAQGYEELQESQDMEQSEEQNPEPQSQEQVQI